MESGVNSEVQRGVRLGYRPELDGLRAVAVAAVVAVHLWGGSRLVRGGFLGVDLFFVLSGFLITRLLLEEFARSGTVALGSFFERRIARLLPAVALLSGFVILDALTIHWLGGARDSAMGAVAALFYVSNWANMQGLDSPIAHTWSLAVEEQFYVIWPLVLLATVRRGGVRLVRNIAGVIFVVSTVQMVVRAWWGVSAGVLNYSTDTRGFIGLMAGCFLATSLPVGRSSGRSWPARIASSAFWPAVGCLALLMIGPRDYEPFYEYGGFAAVAVLFTIVIARCVAGGSMFAPLRWKWLVRLGKLSYGVYLFHYPIRIAVASAYPGEAPSASVIGLITIALTLAVATASYNLIEVPVRKWAVTKPIGVVGLPGRPLGN